MKKKEIKTNDILWQNEISANKMLTSALVFLMALFAYLMVSLYFYRTDKYRWDTGQVALILLGVVAVLLVGILISRHCKYEKPWLKNLLMLDFIFALAVLDVFYTFYVTILFAAPVVLSARYFSRKYTVVVTVLTLLVFLLTCVLGVFYGIGNNANNIYIPPYSHVDMGEEICVQDAVAAGLIPYDPWELLKTELHECYDSEAIQVVIVAVVSFLIAGHGKALVYKQKQLTESTARVGAELNLATKIQADVLPSNFPAFPDRKEFDLFASMTPAKEVGGDFYDFFLIDEDHLGLVIADVSGKGIPAAMFMMFTKNIVANNAMRGMSPAAALKGANDDVCANNTEDMFVTVWIGILTISTGRMVCSSAGHEYPVIKHGSEFELLKDKHGLAVGFIDGSEYDEYELQFEPGDKLFVYTDGVPEATAADKSMYGTERIVDTLNKDVNASCEQMLTNIWEDVGVFVDGAEQFDDLTMLAFEYRG